jgi:arginyl-tRNA synthetase
MKFKKECEKIAGEHAKLLEETPSSIKADLALPCFSLGKNPAEIAKKIVKDMSSAVLVKELKAEGPYVNFYADWDKLGKDVIEEAAKQDYGKQKQKKKIMIEYSSPNTNKPLHVGHLRNDSLGMAISNILEFSGNEVIKTEIINDRGVHISKSMLAYQKWGKGDTPEKSKKKPDHFVGDYYVLFEKELKKNPDLKEEIQGMLKKWEDGDPDVRALWKKMNDWTMKGINQTYNTFGSEFDFITLESDIYNDAQPLIDEGVKKGVISKNGKGDLIVKLEPEMPDKTVLRADGTSVYVTQDLVLDNLRFEKYNFDKLIHVVATEQNLYFKQLFAIFKKLGYEWAENCHHLGYGLVNLPSGRMKTREGTVVDADTLINDLTETAKKEVKHREEEISEEDLKERSSAISLAAIKYYLLKVEPIRDVLFDPEKAISFEGDTGPYLQYTYARLTSVIAKSKKEPAIGNVGEAEIEIVKKIAMFPIVVEKSSEKMKPSLVANYISELASIVNTYYHDEKIIGSKNEESKLAVIISARNVIGLSLKLLGIKTLDKM